MAFGYVFTIHTSVSAHNAGDRERQSVQSATTDMASAQDTAKPKPGDLIEIFRGTYQHWAVYIGDGFVVHLAPDSEVPGAGASSLMSVLKNTAIVKKEELWEVVGTSTWRVNNLLDTTYQPHPVYSIVMDALDLVGRELPYDIFSRNCEHFATQLRYGEAQSRQVRQAEGAVVAAGVMTVGVLGIAALMTTLLGDKNKRKQ